MFLISGKVLHASFNYACVHSKAVFILEICIMDKLIITYHLILLVTDGLGGKKIKFRFFVLSVKLSY